MKRATYLILSYCLFLSFQITAAAAAEEARMAPKAALDRLMEGNERFSNDKLICPDRTKDRRAATFAKQKPFAIVLGCSDSRIPPELAFDQGIGDIFVVRVAGNIVGPTELDSIEYSAINNNSAMIVVLGHENCGAVTAVLGNNTKDIEAIADLIKPGLDASNPSLDEAIVANIRHSMARIMESPVISKLMREGAIDVVGAYYSLETGKVQILPKK